MKPRMVFLLCACSFVFAQAPIDTAWTNNIQWQGNKAIIHFQEPLADPSALPGEVPFSIITPPFIVWMTDSSVRIGWEALDVKKIADTLPYYEPDADFFLPDSSAAFAHFRFHYADITGLSAGTAYQYQIASTNGSWTYTGRVYPFRTLPPSTSKKFRFAIIGDTQRASVSHPQIEITKALADLVKAWDPDFVLHVGDIFLNTTQKPPYYYHSEAFRNINCLSFMRSYFTPMTVGNHDFSTADANPNRLFFMYPLQQANAAASARPPHRYSFEIGNIHFLVFSTTSLGVTEQKNWIEEDLKNTDRTWKVAYTHRPFLCAGDQQNNAPIGMFANFGPIFDKYDVQLLVNGHNHSYQRSWRVLNDTTLHQPLSDSGTVHLISGASSTLAERELFPDPAWLGRYEKWHIYTRVEVDGDTMTFTPVDTGGNIMESWKLPLIGQPIISGGTALAHSDKTAANEADLVVLPNPFNPATTIRFTGPGFAEITGQSATFRVYDIQGNLIEKLELNPSDLRKGVSWNANGLASGVYFLKAALGNKFRQKRLVLTR